MDHSADPAENDELRDEYDLTQLRGGVRGKYAARYRSASNIVCLDPDVAAAFPNEEAVNTALRLLLQAGKRRLSSQRRALYSATPCHSERSAAE